MEQHITMDSYGRFSRTRDIQRPQTIDCAGAPAWTHARAEKASNWKLIVCQLPILNHNSYFFYIVSHNHLYRGFIHCTKPWGKVPCQTLIAERHQAPLGASALQAEWSHQSLRHLCSDDVRGPQTAAGMCGVPISWVCLKIGCPKPLDCHHFPPSNSYLLGCTQFSDTPIGNCMHSNFLFVEHIERSDLEY